MEVMNKILIKAIIYLLIITIIVMMEIIIITKRVIVIMNGTDEPANATDMSRYSEIMHPGDRFKDVLSGKEITIEANMDFPPRAIFVLE